AGPCRSDRSSWRVTTYSTAASKCFNLSILVNFLVLLSHSGWYSLKSTAESAFTPVLDALRHGLELERLGTHRMRVPSSLSDGRLQLAKPGERRSAPPEFSFPAIHHFQYPLRDLLDQPGQRRVERDHDCRPHEFRALVLGLRRHDRLPLRRRG